MSGLTELMIEAVVIIIFLGGLEILLFWLNKKDLQEQNDEMANQTEILEEIADVAAALSDKEGLRSESSSVETDGGKILKRSFKRLAKSTKKKV
jgi:hypothetical protein